MALAIINYMSQQVHTSLQFIQEAHYRLMVDWTHNCCNVMIHLVHMLCDLIRFHGHGWVAMGLTVVGTILNSESKVVCILEKNRIYRTVKIILLCGKDIFTVRQKKNPYGKNVFAVRQNPFCRAVNPANAANFVLPHYKAYGTIRGGVLGAISTCLGQY